MRIDSRISVMKLESRISSTKKLNVPGTPSAGKKPKILLPIGQYPIRITHYSRNIPNTQRAGAPSVYSIERMAALCQMFFACDHCSFGSTHRSEEHTSELQSRGHLVC